MPCKSFLELLLAPATAQHGNKRVRLPLKHNLDKLTVGLSLWKHWKPPVSVQTRCTCASFFAQIIWNYFLFPPFRLIKWSCGRGTHVHCFFLWAWQSVHNRRLKLLAACKITFKYESNSELSGSPVSDRRVLLHTFVVGRAERFWADQSEMVCRLCCCKWKALHLWRTGECSGN